MTSNTDSRRVSPLLGPIIALKKPGSTSFSYSRLMIHSHFATLRLNVTVWVSPAAMVMRVKSYSCLIGVVTVETMSRIYSCGTSSPDTEPVFLMSNVNEIKPVVVAMVGLTTRLEY